MMTEEKFLIMLDDEMVRLEIAEYGNYVESIRANRDGEGYEICIKIKADRDLADWEFNAIFDYYDEEVFEGMAKSITECDDCHVPTWEIAIAYNENFGETLAEILEKHHLELEDVYETIANKKEEYEESSN